MNLLNQALYLVSNAFHIYVFFYCFRTMMGKPKNVLLERICFIAFYAINSTLFIAVNNPYLNLMSSVIPMLLISLLYKPRILFKLLMGLMIYVASMLLDSIGYNATNIFMPAIVNNNYMNVIPSFILFFLALVVKRIKNKEHYQVHALSTWSAIFIIPLCSILVVTFAFYSKYNDSSTLLIMSVLLFINIIVFWLFDKLSEYYQATLEKHLLSEQIHAYTQQMSFIKEQNSVVRGVRHDMKNHVSYLTEYLSVGNVRDAQKYLESMGTYLRPQKEYVCSGNPSLDSFLNYKLTALSQAGVDIETSIAIPEMLPYTDFDLCVIFGNLLDNAYEACSRMSTTAEKRLILKIKFDRGILYIKVENSFDGKLSKAKNAGKVAYRTLKENPDEHGRGLSNVEQIVMKFDGTMDISDSDNMYAVEIMLFQSL